MSCILSTPSTREVLLEFTVMMYTADHHVVRQKMLWFGRRKETKDADNRHRPGSAPVSVTVAKQRRPAAQCKHAADFLSATPINNALYHVHRTQAGE